MRIIKIRYARRGGRGGGGREGGMYIPAGLAPIGAAAGLGPPAAAGSGRAPAGAPIV